MNINKVLLMVFVILLGAVVSAVPTADTVEDDAEAGWDITSGNTTYLDFPFSADSYVTVRNGLTLTRDADTSWGDPDSSNTDSFVNEGGMDDKLHNVANDFQITISGLVPSTKYGIALSVKGYLNNTSYPCDFEWGSESDGEPVNTVTGIVDQVGAVVLSGTNFGTADLFAVPFYRATSDENGIVKLWFGPADHSFDESDRTQIDGVLIGTEILPDKAWLPDPENGAQNVALSEDLFWAAPGDANELWAYDVYIDDDPDPSDAAPIRITVLGGSDPNVPNSLFGPLTAGDYWWRVDAIDPNGPVVHEGDIWTFNAGVPLPDPNYPEDGAGNIPLEAVLNWTSDNSSGLIDHHRLTITDVTDADGVDHTPVSVDIPESENSYDLTGAATWSMMQYSWNMQNDAFDIDREYTWRIDEIGSGDAVLAIGSEWSFRTVALDCTGFTIWGDLTGDCKANFDDLVRLGETWLDCGWQMPGGAEIPYEDKDPCLIPFEQF